MHGILCSGVCSRLVPLPPLFGGLPVAEVWFYVVCALMAAGVAVLAIAFYRYFVENAK